jgi:uncharacterized membrane protein YfcA
VTPSLVGAVLDLPASTMALLALAALVAGFIDAIAGGGGLITVPALALAGLDPVSVLATNKLQGTFGSGSATLAFARAGHLSWRAVWPIALAAAAGSIIGARLLAFMPRGLAEVLLPVMLVAVGLYFAVSPQMGDADAHQRLSRPLFLATAVPLVGLYDGLFGPGAGSLYTLAFVTLLGFGLVRATAHTKVANFASNLAALATLASSGQIFWGLGLLMGVAQFLGARLGAHATLRRGARLVRPLVVVVCLGLAVRLALENWPAIAAVLHL